MKTLGKLVGAKPQFFPLLPPSNEVGVVIAKDANGQPLLVEVLRSVHGVTDEELSEPVYTMAIGKGGVQVQVPGPFALLKAKIANLADLAQAGREDSRHVMILARLLPAYLEDLQKSASEGRMEERQMIGFLEQLLAIVTSKNSQKAFEQLKIEPRVLFVGLKAKSCRSFGRLWRSACRVLSQNGLENICNLLTKRILISLLKRGFVSLHSNPQAQCHIRA